MGKNKPDGKAKGKGSQLVIRIDKAEREAFVTLCDALDTSAAREIRRFMRGFVATHANRQPGDGDASVDGDVTPDVVTLEPPVAEAEVAGTAALPIEEPVDLTDPHAVAQQVA